MKIACFTDAYLPNINGVSFSVDEFAKLLTAKGNEIEIYAPHFKGSAKVEKRGRVTIRRYYSVPIPTYKDAHFTLPDVVKIYNQMEEFNPDVVHINTPGSLGLIGILAAKMLKRPVVGTYHTLISEVLVYASLRKSFGRYLRAIDKVIRGVGIDLGLLLEEQPKPETEKKAGESLPQRVTWSVVNQIYGYCDIVICPSEAIKRELIKRGMKKRVEVVSNGVDLKMFGLGKETKKSTGRIIHVGRLGFEKNVDVVLKAFARLAETNKGCSLVIAGDGPARADLQELAKKLGMEKKVKFLGMIRRDRLAKIYQSGEVFVTASTMETQGMVVLEAMACGLPVVGVRKFALPDLIKDEMNGFVVKPGDEKKMAEKLELILSDEKLRTKLGRQARATAEKHEVGAMANKLAELYAEAMLIKFKQE
jgi:glycosyltransferase involved in cell wall biosynthesis